MSKLGRHGWIRLSVIVVSLVLYAVACTQPAASVAFAHKQGTVIGFSLIIFGWMPGLSMAPAWLSNFPWLAGLVLLARGRRGWAFACSALGLLLASTILLPVEDLRERLLEAKWCWLASHVALATGCGVAWFLRPHGKPVTVNHDLSDPVGFKYGN